MVYVSKGGTVLHNTPLYLKVFRFLASIIFTIIMFFKTMINPDMNRNGNEHTKNYKPGFGPPRPPTRRFGYSGSEHTVHIPIGGGGCSSCAG